MMRYSCTYFIIYFMLNMSSIITNGDYVHDRKEIIRREHALELGGSILLTEAEEEVNKKLLKIKHEEFHRGIKDPKTFLASQNFFNARKDIENSQVFKFIQKVPKGGVLHIHDTAMVSYEYLYQLTFSENLYGRIENDRLQLRFFSKQEDDWILLSEMRKREGFELFIRSQLSIVVDKPEEEYRDINSVWDKFVATFETAEGMITYKPIFRDYFRQVLQELYDDNVMYLEMRGYLPPVYDIEGKIYSPVEILGFYVDVLKEFKKTHEDFAGVKYIYAPLRKVDKEKMYEYLEITKKLKEAYPNFLVGFDLVGQEDLGYPLICFIDELRKINVDLYLHAGETNWYGLGTDRNLIDAILLKTKRIGHGFGLIKHPVLMDMVKEKDIAIEISPISNQVLKLVADLRNHPAAVYIANGLPVVISSDDPSFWDAKGLSYDWYAALMGLGSYTSDLKLLKQFAFNSLNYSSLQNEEKTNAIAIWEKKWDEFIRNYE